MILIFNTPKAPSSAARVGTHGGRCGQPAAERESDVGERQNVERNRAVEYTWHNLSCELRVKEQVNEMIR